MTKRQERKNFPEEKRVAVEAALGKALGDPAEGGLGLAGGIQGWERTADGGLRLILKLYEMPEGGPAGAAPRGGPVTEAGFLREMLPDVGDMVRHRGRGVLDLGPGIVCAIEGNRARVEVTVGGEVVGSNKVNAGEWYIFGISSLERVKSKEAWRPWPEKLEA